MTRDPANSNPDQGSPLESSSDAPAELNNRRRLAALSTLGAELGLTLAVLVLIGWWVDRKLGTTPAFIVTGAAIGIVGALYKFMRVSRQYFDASGE